MTALMPVTPDAALTGVDALVVGVMPGPDGPVLAGRSPEAERACGGRLTRMLAVLGATGTAEEITLVPAEADSPVPLVAAVGLGNSIHAGGRVEPETLRRAAGAAVRALAGRGRVQLTLAVVNGPADTEDTQAVGEGALLAAYEFTGYRRDAADGAEAPVREVALAVGKPGSPAIREAVNRSRTLAAAVLLVRDLVNTPASDLFPERFAAIAAAEAHRVGIDVEIMDETALADGGYGGIHAVGAGSARPPRLAKLSYQPADPTRTIALVGKGITFDSGGLTLKPQDNMVFMKRDMAGAATVLAATIAAAELGLPLAVTTYLPMAENMPSGSAYRPGDVLRMRNGLRVEIHNTDAEGRLVLADALAAACEGDPDYLLCTATLTGAQRIALGHRTAGVMGTEHLTDRVEAAGTAVGEPVWPMPLPDDIPDQLHSDVADLANWCPDSAGGMLLGAAFLSRFITERVSWAHLDISGPAYNTGPPHGYTPTGATGTAVRTLVRTLEDLA